jgi:hypothetical protein
MSRQWRYAWLALFWPWAAAQAGIAKIPEGGVLIDPANWSAPVERARADATAVLAEVGRGDAEAALSLLRGWNDPIRFEMAATLVVRRLHESPDAPVSRAVLAALASEPVRVFRRHEETAADWFMPVFDVGERAASALKLFEFQQARDAFASTLKSDAKSALRAPATSAAVVAAAIAQSDATVLAGLEDLAMRGELELPGVAWAALVQQRPTKVLFAHVLEHAPAEHVLPLFPLATQSLPPADATAWFEAAALQPELASAAVLGLGDIAATYPAAEVALARHLGEPKTGASAAAAFARLARPDRVARIERLLELAPSPAAVANLALALRLEGSEAARQRLHLLRGDPRLPASVKAELQP